MRFLFPAAIAAALAAGPAAAVSIGAIDFENIGNPILDNDPITQLTLGQVTIDVSAFKTSNTSNVYTPVDFNTNRDVSPEGDSDLLFPHSQPDDAARQNFGFIAVLREKDGVGREDNTTGPANDRRSGLPGTMRFEFSTEVRLLSLDAFDFGDTNGDPNLEVWLGDGSVMTRIDPIGIGADGISGDSRMEAFIADTTQQVTAARVLDLVFRSSGGVDNITFEVADRRISTIPLPAGAWLLLSGFGLVAGAKRLRKRAA